MGISVVAQICWPYEETVNIRAKKSVVGDAECANEDNAPVKWVINSYQAILLGGQWCKAYITPDAGKAI